MGTLPISAVHHIHCNLESLLLVDDPSSAISQINVKCCFHASVEFHAPHQTKKKHKILSLLATWFLRYLVNKRTEINKLPVIVTISNDTTRKPLRIYGIGKVVYCFRLARSLQAEVDSRFQESIL
ncbi:hypothetical protein J6590_089814 [Homalodisca vitripennis]|nr:hypothetical protein J6590_089814 [Homalodisca vitripennis]